ncbi:hypothetical protein LSM04_007315 [Trypanosoma melophagium]|uniref:uncharacterized protein n=1 Tax=Trypanosoma melophagium TaxID=715481 RepID=UPI003519E8F3|nr:hypothetical protein LSM04_007315 [Trypanosoma melophagium]
MGYCCCKGSFVAQDSLSSISEKGGDSNKCPLASGPQPADEEEDDDDLHRNQQQLSGDPQLPSLTLEKPTIAKISSVPLLSALSPIRSTRVTVYASHVGPQLPGSFERDLSDTIVCSSTTVENSCADTTMFHRRVETAASSTWPEVSMPTASLRFDHLRTVSGSDSEMDFSPVEGSTSTLHERRLSFTARERDRALLREVSALESEKRYAIVEFFNNAWRTIAIRHCRGMWVITRREMIAGYLWERYVLHMCCLDMQESIHRRLIEYEWQTLLLSKMQKLRVDRQRQNHNELVLASTASTTVMTTAAASTLAATPIEEELYGAATLPLGRCLSAPSVYRRKSRHNSDNKQQQQQQRQVSLLRPQSTSSRYSTSPTPSPPRRRLYKSFVESTGRSLATMLQKVICMESVERLELERRERQEIQEYQIRYEEFMPYPSVV